MPVDKIRNPTMSRWAYRLRSWGLTDGPLLLIIGGEVITRGVSYAGLSGGSHPAESALPMDAWAVIWIIVGIWCLVTAPKPHLLPAQLALSAGVGLNVLWAGSFLAASFFTDQSRGWVTAVGYAALSLVVMWSIWRGRRAHGEPRKAA